MRLGASWSISKCSGKIRQSEFLFAKGLDWKRTGTLFILGDAIGFHCWARMWWNSKLCPHSPAGHVMGARVSQAVRRGNYCLQGSIILFIHCTQFPFLCPMVRRWKHYRRWPLSITVWKTELISRCIPECQFTKSDKNDCIGSNRMTPVMPIFYSAQCACGKPMLSCSHLETDAHSLWWLWTTTE